MRLCYLLILALCFANLDVVYAAPEAPEAKAKTADDDNPTAQFVKLFGEWKQTLGKLYQLRNRFQKDTLGRQEGARSRV